MPSAPSAISPRSLSPFAREVLDLLAGEAAAAEIVIGGGGALAHDAEYRETDSVMVRDVFCPWAAG